MECKLCLDKNTEMQVLLANALFIEKQTIVRVLEIIENMNVNEECADYCDQAVIEAIKREYGVE